MHSDGSEVEIAESDDAIRLCFPVLKVLRPHLRDPEDLLARARRQQAQSGWRLVYTRCGAEIVGCASFRLTETLAWERTVYVDDLVVLQSHRGNGYADRLMEHIRRAALAAGCVQFHLDSGTHRLAAHRFYHRFGLAITAFHFARALN